MAPKGWFRRCQYPIPMVVRKTGIRRPQAVRELVECLEGIYGKARRIARFDPMEELVSCILSQHTTDASSFPAFTKLRETYSTWEEIADADPADLAKTIQKAGLANQKAKSIIGCLKKIHEATGSYSLESLRHMPTMPARDWLMALPGVGPKTASIVLCFSFGRETIPVDTHVFRVAKRLGLLGEKDDENKAHNVLLEMVPKDLAFRFHLALIQHGRKICRAPLPNCRECPLTDRCAWFKVNAGVVKKQVRQARGGS